MSASSSSSLTPPPLILLKHPSPSEAEDRYTTFFASQHPSAPQSIFVPPLDSALVTSSIENIRAQLRNRRNFFRHYGGLVLTSQRAVEALGQALDEDKDSQEELKSAMREKEKSASVFEVFVVGPATGSAVTALLEKYGFPATVRGQDTGNSANLSGYILSNYTAVHDSTSASAPGDRKALLYLVGETHDPAFTGALRFGGLIVDELVVYATRQREDFAKELHAALKNFPSNPTESGKQNHDPWIVAFAPTGCAAMLRALGWLRAGSSYADVPVYRYAPATRHEQDEKRGFQLRCAAIGPKTRSFAWREFNMEFDAVAEKPTPEGLWEAISGHMRGNVKAMEETIKGQQTQRGEGTSSEAESEGEWESEESESDGEEESEEDEEAEER